MSTSSNRWQGSSIDDTAGNRLMNRRALHGGRIASAGPRLSKLSARLVFCS